ncbi:MAG: cation:proton antiporter [Actinomycetota bacterium]
MQAFDVGLIAAFFVAYGLISGRVERSPLTGPMFFVGFGLLIGSAGFDVVDPPLDSEGVELLAEATLALLLFSDAVGIDVRRLRRNIVLPTRMLAIGLPLAIGFGTVLAWALFDIPLAVAALIAAILAPTDAALGQAVVSDEAVPIRVRESLNVESGLNDGIALPAVTLFVALAADEDQFTTAGSWLAFAAEQIGFGVAVGVVIGCGAGWLIERSSARGWMAGVARQLAVLGVAVSAFVTALEVGGNGFIATFVAGLSFGTVARETCAHIEEFTEDLAQLLANVAFIVFGAIVVGPALPELDWRVALYAVGSLVLVRPLAIALSLVGSGLRPQTVGFFGWFGPRGLASILFGISAVEHAHDVDLGPVFTVMSWTVLLSIVAHGVSATPGAAAYGRWWRTKGPEAHDMVEARPMADEPVSNVSKPF